MTRVLKPSTQSEIRNQRNQNVVPKNGMGHGATWKGEMAQEMAVRTGCLTPVSL